MTALGAAVLGLLRFTCWTVAGFSAGIALALALPFAFDARPLTVLSGSMGPALDTGDVAVVERISPLDAAPGDIVTFRDPNRPDVLMTHRVRRLAARGGSVRFITRGDANNVSERWEVSADGDISRVVYRVPELGHALMFLRGHDLFAILFGSALAALLALELATIWRSHDDAGASGEAPV
jgi:signal peptidase